MNKPLRILSLGAGVQSSALLLMSIQGVLPRVDGAIFADTQWEPQSVYDHLGWLEGQAKAASIPIYRVTGGNLREHAIDGRPKKTKAGTHFVALPIAMRSEGGVLGKIRRRQCTKEYKLRPILTKTCELAGVTKGSRGPKEIVIEQWIGISADEQNRMRRPLRRWIVNRYPFVGDRLIHHSGRFEDLGTRFQTRASIREWLEANYPDRTVPRSACIGCPYHQNDEWRNIKADPVAWADAIDADEKIRNCAQRGVRHSGFLHHSGIPLALVDLTIDDSQSRIWSTECQGMCGV